MTPRTARHASRPLSTLLLVGAFGATPFTALAAQAASPAPRPARPTPAPAAEWRRRQEERLRNDWAYLTHYREENARLGPPRPGERRVVFMGNSITEEWAKHFATMFADKPYVGRGISGQTTPQMLVRFRQDVIALQPAVVVLLAGTNDIAGNTGPATLEMIQDNIASMVDLATAHGIRVVLASVLPAHDYPWKPGLRPAPTIVALNAWLRAYAGDHGLVYLDYHSAMRDERDGLRAEYSADGVHPNEAGYRVMAPLAERAIAEALGRQGAGVAEVHSSRASSRASMRCRMHRIAGMHDGA